MTRQDMLNTPAVTALVNTAREKFGVTPEYRIVLEEAITEMIAAVGEKGTFQTQLNRSLYPYLAASRILEASGVRQVEIISFLQQSRENERRNED